MRYNSSLRQRDPAGYFRVQSNTITTTKAGQVNLSTPRNDTYVQQIISILIFTHTLTLKEEQSIEEWWGRREYKDRCPTYTQGLNIYKKNDLCIHLCT